MSEPITGIQFSPREMQMLALAWQCFDSDPKVDCARLASLGGWTEGSARVMLNALKRKLKTVAGDPNALSPSPKKTPGGGGRGKKRAAGSEEGSPTKKAKGKAKGKKVAEPDEDDQFPDSKDDFWDSKIKEEDVAHVDKDFEDFLHREANAFY